MDRRAVEPIWRGEHRERRSCLEEAQGEGIRSFASYRGVYILVILSTELIEADESEQQVS